MTFDKARKDAPDIVIDIGKLGALSQSLSKNQQDALLLMIESASNVAVYWRNIAEQLLKEKENG